LPFFLLPLPCPPVPRARHHGDDQKRTQSPIPKDCPDAVRL
jgi:hypothetical protein